MVNTPITTMKGFDAYFGLNQTTVNSTQKSDQVVTIVLIGGCVLISALAVYLAFKNNDLSKKLKKASPRKLEYN